MSGQVEAIATLARGLSEEDREALKRELFGLDQTTSAPALSRPKEMDDYRQQVENWKDVIMKEKKLFTPVRQTDLSFRQQHDSRYSHRHYDNLPLAE